jgi:hypothetical protein
MARKTAIDRIEYHEKICRIMQKQTFERIERMENRIMRLEKFIIGGLGCHTFSCTFTTSLVLLTNEVSKKIPL